MDLDIMTSPMSDFRAAAQSELKIRDAVYLFMEKLRAGDIEKCSVDWDKVLDIQMILENPHEIDWENVDQDSESHDQYMKIKKTLRRHYQYDFAGVQRVSVRKDGQRIADELGIKKDTISQWCRNGEIVAWKTGPRDWEACPRSIILKHVGEKDPRLDYPDGAKNDC